MLCHFPNMNGQIDPSLVVVLVGLWCKLCGQSSRIVIMLICDQCFKRRHMWCLMPPLDGGSTSWQIVLFLMHKINHKTFVVK